MRTWKRKRDKHNNNCNKKNPSAWLLQRETNNLIYTHRILTLLPEVFFFFWGERDILTSNSKINNGCHRTNMPCLQGV